LNCNFDLKIQMNFVTISTFKNDVIFDVIASCCEYRPSLPPLHKTIDRLLYSIL